MALNKLDQSVSIPMLETNLSAALAYAKWEWHVLPIHAPLDGGGCSCSQKVCNSIGKHPVFKGGWKIATTDSEQIKEWFDNGLRRNIAIATGAISGLFVLDVDGRAGEDSLQKLEAKYGVLPATVSVITGRGRHLYFKSPPEKILCSAGKLGQGLDVRGDGGIIIAPPSLHQNGKRYAWS